MAENLQNQLKEVGSKLEHPPASKDDLIKLLTQATESLSELDQSPPKALLDSMQPLLHAIVKPQFLKHEDKEVSLLVAICTCEITRITAPEAPYDDDVLKDIFRLFVSTFNGLKDTKDPSFEKRAMVLDTVAKYRSFVVMLDLECDDLVNEMFKTFFTVASDEHHATIISSMETIMVVLLEESEEIGEDLLLIILSFLGRDKKDVTSSARKLAMSVIKQSAGILEPLIKKFLVSSMSGDNNTCSNPQIDHHEVIYDIYRCAPETLSKVVPYLKRELLADRIDIRSKAVKFVGDLFSIKGSTIPQTFHPLFLEFLNKFTDKVVEIRMSVIEHAKICLLSDPSRTEAQQLIAALSDRLSDDDESIRKQVVGVISDVASLDLSSISSETIKLLSKLLEDKSVVVKKYTLERLSDIYKTWCLKKVGDLNVNLDYDWIPARILKSLFDNDLGLDTVEYILSTSLFPVEISVKDKVKNWVKLYSKFDKVEVNALEKILEQRERLQLELKKYLSLRETYKDSDSSELQKKITICVRFMSQCFHDPIKAEADFQILDQLKDDKILNILTSLVDPTTTSLQSKTLHEELLKIVGEKHPLYELLSTLSIKCSYLIFDKEFVKNLVLEIDQQKSDGNKLLTQSCVNILVTIASFSHLLLSGIEEDLVHLLEDYDDEAIKEGVLCVLAKAGETIRGQLGESSSTLDLILERICLEGSRSQAKNAVHALSAITKDDGLKSLSVLYKRLVDVLEERTNLPSVLESLGCIAQIAMPVFETQESKIEEFIRKDILSCSHKPGNKAKKSWDNKSEVCSLKILGIKTLVKSYLPVKDANLRVGIDELLKDLHNILSFGEISKDVESSSVDKAHLKLASAKAIIRLSKHWDKKIPVDLFHLTLRTSQAGFPQVRKLFLKKVHQYIKNGSLDPKYICAFLLDFGSRKPILEEDNKNLSDILEMCEFSVYNILPYLVHALAHHPSCPNIDECKDVKAYEPIYRKLYIYFCKLAQGDEERKAGVGLKREDTISIISVIRTIKFSKDAVDINMSKKSYAICDLCLIIIKGLAQKQEDVDESVVPVSLPDVLYTPHKKNEEEKEDGIEVVNKEDEKIEEINKEDDKMEEDKKDEKKEESNKEDEKKDDVMEEDTKDEKTEEINKEDEKMEEEETNKEIETKEDKKIEEDNKDEKMEEDNKDGKGEKEKIEEDNKIEKKEEINTESKNKEDEKMEEDNTDGKKEEEINKEDEKKKEDNKIEKTEEINTEDKNKEDKKMEEDNTDDKKEEEINKEDEKKKEDNTEVTEGKTWLADDSVLAYFQSLILEPNGNIVSKTNDDDIMKDSETDGTEIPLGKVLKRLKARKEVKNGPTPTPIETDNNVDIMGMLREINSDNSTKIDSTNANGHKEIKNESNLKRKNVPHDLANVSVPVPKRRRSTSKRSSFVASGPAFNSKLDHSDSEDKGIVIHKEEGNITDEIDLEKPKKAVESGSNQKSVNLKKRKRRRVSRLVKCTRDETDFKTKDLIGRRIKVWWPMDKEYVSFYEGLVKSYDRENNKHVVLYDDGDIEVLCLDKERWKLAGSGHKLAERKLMSYTPPHKGGTPKRNKSSDRSKKTKQSTDISPTSMVRGKRTPRQNLKQGQKGVSQRSSYLEINSKDNDDISKPTISTKGEENSDKLEKPRSKKNQTKDAESSSNDSMSSSSHKTEPGSRQKETENDESTPGDKSVNEAHKSDSEGNNEEDNESSTDVQTPDGKQSSSSSSSDDDGDADMAELEFTDDEPLGVWKSRVGKSGEGK
ncbi:hypothetical protein LXL04_009957 [Taraxacum kok-saghyz]